MTERKPFGQFFLEAASELRRLTKPLEDPILNALDVRMAQRQAFHQFRNTSDYWDVFDKREPLVSICIATYNRARLLLDRSLRSCINQTYRNIEIIVVGDACTDDTAKLMADVTDPRVRFVNLPDRGRYPDDAQLRWMVAGTAPVNHALSIARGDFITHLDDDDEHAPDRVEVLLEALVQNRADLIYHPFRYELPDGSWEVSSAESFRFTQVTTSSIFYHGYFRGLSWDPLAYRYREPGDWNRLRKIRALGAKIIRDPRTLLSHYRERSQMAS